MSNRKMPQSDDRAFCWLIDSPISKERYVNDYIPGVRDILDKRGEIRMAVYFENYQGWNMEAVPIDMEFMSTYYKHIGRVALINPPEKIVMRAREMSDLIGGEVRTYNDNDLDGAIAWVKEA